MLPLRCPAQNYAWGRPAASSEVAKLAKANGASVDETKPFAELWVGTHPSGPALLPDDTTLKSWVEAHPESLGAIVLKRFGTDLPFLFKVLSVQTALSIQSHPDKKLAERLHAENPAMYKDDNHKPEMALALEDFEALSSFVSHDELVEALRQHPELRACVGEEQAAGLEGCSEGSRKQALKAAFSALMTCESGKVAEAIATLVARLQQEQAGGRALSAKESLVLRLDQQYPKDVGVLSAFFLNLISLKAGQAIYLAANEPHAYVSGELVECMATSDNVIRAGLTPKFRDTAVLCESLTYSQGLPEVLSGAAIHDHIKLYQPPFEEFETLAVDVPAGSTVDVPVNQGPMLLLVQKGAGQATSAAAALSNDVLVSSADVARGSILFVPAGSAVSLTAADGERLFVWGAACNRSLFAAAAPAPVAEPALVAA